MPSAIKKRLLQHLEKGFARELAGVTVTEVDEDWLMEYELEGIRYKPTLAPEAQLVIRFNNGGIKETKLLIGTKNHRKMITTAAPTQGSGEQDE